MEHTTKQNLCIPELALSIIDGNCLNIAEIAQIHNMFWANHRSILMRYSVNGAISTIITAPNCVTKKHCYDADTCYSARMSEMMGQ